MTASPSQPIVGRILHLGLSNFHRTHQVVYLQRLKDQGEAGWQLAGTNIRPDANPLLEALAVQDGNFTLETIDPNGKVEYHWITAIDQVIPYDASLKTITELATDPITRIISFTVTEAGYYLLENGDLDTSFPDLNRPEGRPGAREARRARPDAVRRPHHAAARPQEGRWRSHHAAELRQPAPQR